MWTSIVISVVLGFGQLGVSLGPPSTGEVADALVAAGVMGSVEPAQLDELAALVGAARDAGVLAGIASGADPADRVEAVGSFWGVVGPEWRDVAGRSVLDLITCRQSMVAGGGEACRRDLSHGLWLAHAERLRSTIVMRLSMAEDLGPIDRDRVTRALLIVRDRAVLRMLSIVGDEDGAQGGGDREMASEVGAVLGGIAGTSDDVAGER